MTVKELIDALKKMPPQAPIVFDDSDCEDENEYEAVEVKYTGGEVFIVLS